MTGRPDRDELAAALSPVMPGPVEIRAMRRLTGGATRSMWAFDAVDAAGTEHPLVLRRGGTDAALMLPPAVEHRLLAAAVDAGVPAPRPVAHVDDGFIMTRLQGETIPTRILREPDLADARASLARELGHAAGRVQAVPPASVPDLAGPGPGQDVTTWTLDVLEGLLHDVARSPQPVLELGLRWLRDRLPALPAADAVVVHGDLRMGNVMVDRDGLVGVLDWDLAHRGHPLEDLGWMCVRSWRFGADDRPAAGVGSREDLLEGYEAATGRAVEPAALTAFEALGNLRWGVICLMQARPFLDGDTDAVEPAAIGRRVAEAEWELLTMIEEQ